MLDLISQIPLVGGLIATILPFVLVIGIVVFIHEYGHYIVGRWCGIHADVFSLGFGKVVFSRRDKRGTEWQVAALPLGGFVKFRGDQNASSLGEGAALAGMNEAERRSSFPGAPLWARTLTVAAGPMFNFLLATVIFFGMVLSTGVASNAPVIGEMSPALEAEVPLRQGDLVLRVGETEIEDYAGFAAVMSELPAGQPVEIVVERAGRVLVLDVDRPRPPNVIGVRPLSSASRAGIQPGDVIVSVDGQPTPDFEQLKALIVAAEGREIAVMVRRGSGIETLTMRPTMEDVQQADGTFTREVIIGVTIRTFVQPQRETPGVLQAAGLAVGQTVGVVTGSLDGLMHIIRGDIGAENLQGPVGIAQVSGETASRGLTEFIMLIAILSTAIGLMNLFPIPVLDGGHLVFYAWEAVTGKPPHGRAMEIATALGLATVLSLMVFATYNDLARLFSTFA